MLAAAYAVCLAFPVAALAVDGSRASHCLTQDHHHSASVHVHADGAVHSHDGESGEHPDQQAPAQNCCGLGCLSAVTAELPADLTGPVRFTLVTAPPVGGDSGRAPERLYRPPISPSSL